MEEITDEATRKVYIANTEKQQTEKELEELDFYMSIFEYDSYE